MQSEVSPPRKLGVPYKNILRHHTVPLLLGAFFPEVELVSGQWRCSRDPSLEAVLSWGRKPKDFSWRKRLSSSMAERLSTSRGLPLWRCEDTFIRSLAPGPASPPLGMVLDDLGIYYDASVPSRLDSLISRPRLPGEIEKGRSLIQLWRDLRISKYNNKPEALPPANSYVLVIDQTAGDCSIPLGSASQHSFMEMLDAALKRHPESTILVKTHPVVASGQRRGHFTRAQISHPRVHLEASGGHPSALLEHAEAVYVVTSQLGFEALMWGKRVYCFGMPFYAGWGLTVDQLPAPSRRSNGCKIESLVCAALLDYGVYLDPFTKLPCPVEVLMEAIGQHRQAHRGDSSTIAAVGFSRAERGDLTHLMPTTKIVQAPFLKQLLTDGSPLLVRRARQSSRYGDWPGTVYQVGPGPLNLLEETPKQSYALNRIRHSHNGDGPSELEAWLTACALSQPQLERARALRSRLISACLTRTSSNNGQWARPSGTRRVALAACLGEEDEPLFDCPIDDLTEGRLHKAARSHEPSSYLIYHTNSRTGSSLTPEAASICDRILEGTLSLQLLKQIDSVHVGSSSIGLFALMLGLDVATWGTPFYAGWGLTRDAHSFPWRQRVLSLDELIYATFIEFPRYISKRNSWLITAERAIDELDMQAG